MACLECKVIDKDVSAYSVSVRDACEWMWLIRVRACMQGVVVEEDTKKGGSLEHDAVHISQTPWFHSAFNDYCCGILACLDRPSSRGGGWSRGYLCGWKHPKDLVIVVTLLLLRRFCPPILQRSYCQCPNSSAAS